MKRALFAVGAVILVLVAFKALQSRMLFGIDGPSPGGPARPRNVLLITLDTTRADRIGTYGYAAARTPHLDALAREGARFDDATAQAPITGPSHAAMLTGHYPARHGVRDNATTPLPDEALTLAEVLQAQGFATGGFVGAFILDRPYGFAQGFTAFNGGFTRVDSGGEANAERRGDAVVDDALAWVNGLAPAQPFFGWVHLYDPHVPYEGGYDEEIAFVDSQIGRLLDGLRSRGLFDDTLVMAIADHGESLGEHGEDEHGVFLYEAVLRVPWIVRGPGVPRGRAIAEQVRTVDLFPTVLDALGIPLPGGLDGETLWPVLKGGTRASAPASYAESYYPRFHYGWSELRSIRADGWKAIDAPRPELYNLRDDPGELRNLYATQQALADRMIADAVRLDREMGGGETVAVRQPDRETMERLRSLGYVGVVASPAVRGERGPDPKDRIDERRRYSQTVSAAIDDLRGGRAGAAIVKLRQLVKENERAYDLHVLLGEAYESQGKLDEALGEYEMAALLNSAASGPHLSAAEVQLARRDVAGARRKLEEASRIDPASFDVALVTGRVLEAEGKTQEAAAAYEKAIAVNGANPRPRRLLVELAIGAGRHDVAEAQLRELLKMGYQPARSHAALGRLLQMRGANAEAADHYRAALRLDPGLTMARQGLESLGMR
jgi:arylsulfatase A-like enzyme/Tfp pilus assembly protein PilF